VEGVARIKQGEKKCRIREGCRHDGRSRR
jgi:hypothetical protein